MKSNSEEVSLLDQYLKNQLSDEDRRSVEERLKSDIALREDYEFLLKVKADARTLSLSAVWDEVKGFEEEYQMEVPKVGKKTSIKWMYWSLAGIFLLCFIASYFVFFKDNNEGPQAKYADLFENRFEKDLILHVTYRSPQINQNLTRTQKQAYDLYSLKEFKTAIPLLKNLWEKERDTLALFYWGVSELGLGQVDKSKDILLDPALKKFDTSFINK
jgi:hypothetical protein